MDLKELRQNSRKMLATFLDSIDLDGEWYSELNTTPLVWGKPKFNGCGEFVSPGSERLEELLETKKYDDKTRKILTQKGMILINQSYRQQEVDADLYVTLIHEILHANRDLLIFDTFRRGRNESAYSYNNGRFEQNTEELSSKHADASQEILKGSIDTSRKTVESYESKTSEELEDMEFAEGKIDAQMEKQQIVDESLVELMAVLSYKLYSSKQKGKELDVWTAIEQARDAYEGEDIGAMCEIILRHHDFELFYWMIDPITYSQGDIHYDFFGQYTKDDQDLLKKLYDAGEFDLDDALLLDSPDVGGINTSDIKKVANSETAIEELSSSFADIKQAQTQTRKDKERI